MPAIYAHYKMGTELLPLLKKTNYEASLKVEAFPDLFMVGLHGPDILFFYRVFFPNKVSKLGHTIHGEPGANFFENASAITKVNKGDPAFLSYLYGVICHFALDLSCHGYVAEKMNSSGISHTEIESEFDGYLMRLDGLDPISYKPTAHLVSTPHGYQVIKNFYTGTSSSQIKSSINYMRKISNFLITPSETKRKIIYTSMKAIGLYKGGKGLIINKLPNPNCTDSNEELLRRLNKSIPLGLNLISQVESHINNQSPLGEEFQYGFNSLNKEGSAYTL